VATSEGEYFKLSHGPPFRVSRNTEAWDLVSMVLAFFLLFGGRINSGIFLNVLSVNKYLAYYASG
jgi:hypothetical protein